jgi:hypothetical protein
MKCRVIVGIVLAAGMATPAVAAADRGGNPAPNPQPGISADNSCGEGSNGKATNSQSGGVHIHPQSNPNDAGCSSGKATGRAAQAGVIRLGPYTEVEDRRSQRQHDADGSHSNTPGDFFTERIFLLKRGKRVGTVQIKSTIVTLNGSQAHLRDEYTATIRRQGAQAGGTLTGVYEHDEDFNAQPKVGDVDHLPITRGTGRFTGYTGEVASRVVKVAGNGQPFYRDTIVLRRAI